MFESFDARVCVGAVRQMVATDRLGLVVPVHDDTALVAALRSALMSSWDHEAIAVRGRARSWNQVADDVIVEMRAVVERAHVGRADTGRL